MPPKNGPATTKSLPASAEGSSDATPTPEVAPEPQETPEQGSETEAPQTPEQPQDDPKVNFPGKHDRESAAKMYPENTDLWYGEVGGLVFAFPRIATITPPRQWLRQIYQITELAQSFEWMALAKVPQEMQDQTDFLTDDQYWALFRAWYVDGEVELPK